MPQNSTELRDILVDLGQFKVDEIRAVCREATKVAFAKVLLEDPPADEHEIQWQKTEYPKILIQFVAFYDREMERRIDTSSVGRPENIPQS